MPAPPICACWLRSKNGWRRFAKSAASSRANRRSRANAGSGGNRDGRLQNKSAEIGVFGEIAHVLMHVGGVDLDCLPGAVGCAEGNIVEHALHHRLQAPRTDILDA